MRDHCLLLHIEAFHCSEVLVRILALLADFDFHPVEIDYDRGAKRTRIVIRFDRAALLPTARLLSRIEALKNVRSADYFDGAGVALDVGWKKRQLS